MLLLLFTHFYANKQYQEISIIQLSVIITVLDFSLLHKKRLIVYITLVFYTPIEIMYCFISVTHFTSVLFDIWRYLLDLIFLFVRDSRSIVIYIFELFVGPSNYNVIR